MVSKLDKRNAKDIKETFHNLSQSGSYGSYYQKDEWREKAMRDAYSKEADKGEDLLAVRDERKTQERRAKSTRKKVFGNTVKKIAETVGIAALSLCLVAGIGAAAEHFSSNHQIKQENKVVPTEFRVEEASDENIIRMPTSMEMSVEEVPTIEFSIGTPDSSVKQKPTIQSYLEAVQTDVCKKCGNTHVATKGTVAVTIPLDKGNSR